jgi:chemotaxis regulatin CheY-phosphate phosphatase CheZ
MAAQMNTSEKIKTCLEYIDQRLETTSEQTIQIAETIINDIKILTQGYSDALKNHQLVEHSQQVRDTQMKWVNQLHDIILEQTDRDLNGQVIQSLQKFATQLNQTQLNSVPFELPSIVARQQPNQYEYLDQDEIELLMSNHSTELGGISTSRH